MEHIISRALALVILDCDGVLFDSFRSNVVYYNTMLEKMGEPPLNTEAERLSHVLSTPHQLPEGSYWLQTGAYWLDPLERWDVVAQGETVGDRILLTQLEVSP